MAASSSIVASASIAPHPSNNQWYEVFISHRGPDTKKTFARLLYLRLLENGVRAFLDEKEMQRGYDFPSQIKQAISTASVHVAILSRGYAESNWCLDELLQMLQTGAPTIPVFYGVPPYEVRWTRGKNSKYAQDLQNLAKKKTQEKQPRYGSKKIKKWRNALSRVADFSGFELEACNIGEEVEVVLLDKVVKRLLEILKKEKPDLHVAKYPTGLDEKLRDFEDKVGLQQQQSGRSQMLGIWGLGGIGKSTLAREFYNRRKSDFQKSCFLHDVKDNEAKEMQRELLKSLTGKDETVNNVDIGTEMLKKHLKSCNALVILDDVDNVNQVEELLPVEIRDLHPHSLILITSRDKQILISSKVEDSSIYWLRELIPDHSRVLFCSYAFSQPHPKPTFEALVDRFLEACKGLPLSLKVFGALLYGRDQSDWEDELGSLQDILPKEIHKRFELSYNKLNFQEKQIFLDIACYFIGTDKETAIGIWNSSGWRGRKGFQTLQNKCLVELDSFNRIRMHDHVRDLRIEFAESSAPRRLWRRTKNVVGNLLDSEIRSVPVRGIRMVHGEHDEDNVFGFFATDIADLERIFRNLKILDTENDLLECILRKVELTNLLWLTWRECPHSTLPSWVGVKNLKYLDVSDSKLNTLWEGEGELQEPLQLPECLEELWAKGCVQLKNIRGLERCTRLRILSIWGCSELEELPCMAALVCLEDLCANDCVKLKRIRGLEHATKLQKLRVQGCSQLQELPAMEALLCLEELWANRCVKLKNIRGLERCTRLRILSIWGCSELEELPCMAALVCLEDLCANDCVKLKRIRGLEHATKLQKLRVQGCSQLQELPAMEALLCLEELWANRCVKLKNIRGLERCTRLRILSICGCSELEELPCMAALVCLEDLCANDCVKLKRIRGLEYATKLQKLGVQSCSQLQELPAMEALLCLEELCANRCVKLKNIRGLERCTRLRILSIWGCSELEELPCMAALVCLEGLCANDCVKLKRIRGLEHATKLQKLGVQSCSQLQELPAMEALLCLEELWANRCVKLKNIRGLERCTRLRILSIFGCSELEELPCMAALVCLEELYATECGQRIRGLEHATKLQKLSVRWCSELEEAEGVEHLSLEMLDVSKCHRLQCPVRE
eukprot:PITA_05227